MSKQVVAIVGRPNVGKSTLFNLLAGEKISIVKDTPGVTRDRIYADTTWCGHDFTIIDTGGIDPDTSDILLSKMREQAEIAIDTADVILFLTDVRDGLLESDREVALMLRKSGRPVVLAVNKTDNFEKFETDLYAFYELGLGDPYPISAHGKLGIGDLLDAVVAFFPEPSVGTDTETRPRIAIIGKPNVGKSSIINALLGEDRVLVSNIPGTTRDAIDTKIKANGKEDIFVDTAGLRKKSRRKEDLEFYSVIRAVSAVDKAEVAVLVINAEEGVTEQDAKIAGIAHESGKGMLILVNKWDAVEKETNTTKKFEKDIRQVLSFVPYADILFVSAKTGQRLVKIYPMIDDILESRTKRIPTGVLNEVLTEAVALNQPPSDKGKRLRIYYMTQVAVGPPSFAMFVNDRKLMHFSYQRYIENQIRSSFGFRGTPLKFFVRERGDGDK